MNNENVNLQQTTSDTNGMIHKSLNNLKYNDSIISKLKDLLKKFSVNYEG